MNKEITDSQKVLLIVRDGWGHSSDFEHNMIAQADTPYTDGLEKKYPTFLTDASGESVGLPAGKFGNSEVGHMTLGAGRVLEQSLLRINHAISDGSFFEKEAFLSAIKNAKENNSKLHIIGLVQKEGVHSSFEHIIALVELAKQESLSCEQVCIHVITDGRDAPKQNSKNYILELDKKIKEIGVGKIVSLSGRYFAMDRNKNWDRTKKYYDMLTGGSIENFSSLGSYFDSLYVDQEFSDEFLDPIALDSFVGFNEKDSIIFANFRKDRARQITAAFVDKNFAYFSLKSKLQDIMFCSMTEYFPNLENVAFLDLVINNTLGEILERNNKTQLRIAETEKFAHVTFFFDGGIEKNFEGEKKILVPSSDVPTFDQKPEMSAPEITERLIFEIENSKQDFILCNIANADMVGHSGDHEATKKGVHAVDVALSEIVPVAIKNNYSIILTADHGNAEQKHGDHETSHTSNKVPTTFIGFNDVLSSEGSKSLADILSFILCKLNIK